jgi:hypothetical protein
VRNTIAVTRSDSICRGVDGRPHGQDYLVAIPTFNLMLATPSGRWPKNPVIEPKWDGVRSICTPADGPSPSDHATETM